MPIINFQCKKCKKIFNFDVGKITHQTIIGKYPSFEKDIVCSNCGVLKLNEVELTELGQSQMTKDWCSNQDISLFKKLKAKIF